MSEQNAELAARMRHEAEERLRALRLPLAEDGQANAALIHELQVHQIELELQNEELRRLHVDLDASRARYFDLYDLAPVGYLTLSDSGLVQGANLMGACLLGSTRAALLKQPFSRFLEPTEMDAFYLLRKKALADDQRESLELRMARLDGTGFWAHLAVKTALEDGARVLRVVLTDVTERKQLETQLLQAQKLESIGRLAGGVAHDFNNMLTVIMGNADEALAKTAPSDPLHADLLEIKNAAERSADLTRQLLAFARKQLITPVEVNLNERLSGLVVMLKRLLGADLTLAIKTSDALWPIKMDPSQLDQILLNLCINARDAIAGVGSISIETANCVVDADACKDRLTARPGDFVRLTVSDTGAGMPPAILAHVFEPFFTTKGVGNGLGLGLATVHGAVSQNEGFIEVTSEPGLGTSFQVYLPRHRPAGSTLNEPMGLRVDGNETILLVDDEPSILRATARMLEGRGYTVLSAPGPKEALALVRTHAGKIHLLLTDVIMPSMNGRDLAQEVVALRPQVRCVFMSGFTAEVLDGKAAVHFLQKPFTAEELSTKVRAALG